MALKDYGGRPWWVRHVLGRWLIGREARAYRRVAGVPGLPRFLGRLGPWALATEWIEGTPLPHPLDGPRPPDECFERLTALVDALHARGVALGDLHHRNVVLGASGSPHVVDLATAWLGRAGGGRQDGAWLFRRWREADRVALARLRARFDGTDPQAAAAAAAGRRPAVWHERARRLKRRWDRWRRR